VKYTTKFQYKKLRAPADRSVVPANAAYAYIDEEGEAVVNGVPRTYYVLRVFEETPKPTPKEGEPAKSCSDCTHENGCTLHCGAENCRTYEAKKA